MKMNKFLDWILGAACLVSAEASHAVLIEFAPGSSLTVTTGGSIAVDVVASDLNGSIVSAFDLDVLYDEALLSPTNVVFGLELGIPNDPIWDAIAGWDDVGGVIDLAEISLLFDSDLALLQDGVSVTLATLMFTGVADGTTDLAFSWGPFDDVKGANNQVIFPTSVPEPASGLLFATGAALLAWRRKRS